MKKILSFLFVGLLLFLLVGCAVTETESYLVAIPDSDNNVTLEVGDTKQITATYEGGTLEWLSSDDSVVSVTNGLLTALKAGNASVTARLKEKTEISATISITVKEKAPEIIEVTGIALAGKKTEVEVGDEFNLRAVITPTNATDQAITWASSDATVATVVNGKVTALKAGTTEISATAGGKTDKFTLTVNEKAPEIVDPEEIYLDHTKESLMIGETDQLEWGIDPEEASQEVEWTVDPAECATVSETGLLTAVKGGLVTIKVSAKDDPAINDSYQLRIYDNIEDMTVDYARTMQVNATQKLVVNIAKTRADGSAIVTMSEVAFESDNTDVLTVDERGIITAVSAGTAKITVTAQDSGQFKVELEITAIVAVIKIDDKTYNSLTTALAEAKEGDTIVLGSGSYSGDFEVTKNNLTIIGPNYGKNPNVTGRGAEAEFVGNLKVAAGVNDFTLDGVAFTGEGMLKCPGDSENIILKNLYIHDTAERTWSEGKNVSIEGSLCFIHAENDQKLTGLVISDSLFEDLKMTGISLIRVNDVKVENCVFHNFALDAIRSDGGYNNGKWEFYNNKFYNDELAGYNGIYLQSTSGNLSIQEIYVLNNYFENIGAIANQTQFKGAFNTRTYQEKGMKLHFMYNTVKGCANGMTIRNNGESDLSKYEEKVNYNVFINIAGHYHRNFTIGSGDTAESNPVESNFDYNLFLGADGSVLTYDQVKAQIFEVKSCENTFTSVAEYAFALNEQDPNHYTKFVSPTFAGNEAGAEVTLGELALTMGTDAFATIKDAVDAAADADVIYVAAGTYTDDFTIAKSITLEGPNAGVKGYEYRLPEAIIAGKILVNANNVTLDGFTMQSQTTFPADAQIDGFTYKNNILEVFGGEGFINSNTAVAYLKNVVISGNYSPAAKGPRWFRFAYLENLQYTDNKAIGTGIYSYLYVDKCLRGEVTISGNYFENSAQDCFMIMGVGAMTLTIKDNYFKGMESTVIDTRALVADYAGDVTEIIVNNIFDHAGAGWRCLRPRNTDYGDNKLDVQVHYNAFINGCCAIIDNVKSYANNPAGTDVIFNMDHNYFQEVEAAEVSGANFAGNASSWADCFDSLEDVRLAYDATLTD